MVLTVRHRGQRSEGLRENPLPKSGSRVPRG